MPRFPINYDNTFFYKIVCKDLTIKDLYIGHTTDFATRKRAHKNNSINNCFYVYQFIRGNGGWDNFDMILLEKRKCDDALHAKQIERKYIEDLNATLNQRLPARTSKEWYETNRDRMLELRHLRQYINVEHTKQKVKAYAEAHKDEIKEWKNTKVLCSCGSIYTNSNKSQHMKTKKHLNSVNQRIELED